MNTRSQSNTLPENTPAPVENNSEMSLTTALSIEFLASLIPNTFNGNRSTFSQFISDCDNAISLCAPHQMRPILIFIISRISGSAREQIEGKIYNSWEEVKNDLRKFYKPQNDNFLTYIQLMERLNNLRQDRNESVTSFFEKIEKTVKDLTNSITAANNDQRQGKVTLINDLATNRFIYHSHPDISRFLRTQNLKSLSEAVPKALEEETAISNSKNFNYYRDQKFYDNDHNNKYYNPSRNFQRGNTSQKFCNYCKKSNHSIEECRKREYNNKFKTQNNVNNKNIPLASDSAVHLNYKESQVKAALVD